MVNIISVAESEVRFMKLHVILKTAPFTKRTTVQSIFPASLDTSHVYFEVSVGFTE